MITKHRDNTACPTAMVKPHTYYIHIPNIKLIVSLDFRLIVWEPELRTESPHIHSEVNRTLGLKLDGQGPNTIPKSMNPESIS